MLIINCMKLILSFWKLGTPLSYIISLIFFGATLIQLFIFCKIEKAMVVSSDICGYCRVVPSDSMDYCGCYEHGQKCRWVSSHRSDGDYIFNDYRLGLCTWSSNTQIYDS